MIVSKRLTSAVLAVFLLLWGGVSTVSAEEEHDHDRARAALEAGQVRPLAEILEAVRRDYPGEVIDVELEEPHRRRHGRHGDGADAQRPVIVYEIKVRLPDGRIVKLIYDALTGVRHAVRTW